MGLEQTIINYYSPTDKRRDTNKDEDGKGTLERFNECIGADMDELIAYPENMVKELLDPAHCLDKFVGYLESAKGIKYGEGQLIIYDTLTWRRRVAKYFGRLVSVKGTIFAYEVIFGWLAIEVEIEEFFPEGTFDSDETLDSETKTLDMSCPACTEYSIYLTSLVVLNQDLIDAINRIVKWNTPINAVVRDITYNEDPIYVKGDFNNDFSNDFYNA